MDPQQILDSAVRQAANLCASSYSDGFDGRPVNKRVYSQLENGGFGGGASSSVVPYVGSSVPAGGSADHFYTGLGLQLGSASGDPRIAAGSLLAGSALDYAGGFTGIANSMKSFLGMGDYSLKTNSLIRSGAGGRVQIVSSGPRSTRIRFREYIGDVYTHPTEAGAFHITSYPLNPGLSATFKWLPPIAAQYEQWTPNGIVFEFRSTSSEFVSQQSLGSVIMATEYDSYDSPYSSKVEMLNAAYSNEGKPSDGMLHGVECDPRDNPNSIFYVRTGPLGSSDGDIRDYDLGVFYVATQGIPYANANLGSLYIHYDITFRKEQMFGGILNRNMLYVSYELPAIYTDQPFCPDDSRVLTAGNIELPLTYDEGFQLPASTVGATWLMVYYVNTASGVSALANLYSGGVTTPKLYSVKPDTPGQGSGADAMTAVAVFTQTAASAAVAFEFVGNVTPGSTGWFNLMQISSDVNFP